MGPLESYVTSFDREMNRRAYMCTRVKANKPILKEKLTNWDDRKIFKLAYRNNSMMISLCKEEIHLEKVWKNNE